MKVLYTERLILRPWTIQDAEDMYDYAKSPVVGPAAGWAPHQCFQDSLDYLSAAIEEGDTCAIEYKENHKVIGAIGLHRDSLRASSVASRCLGYVLHEDYWGKGLMTEAAQEIIRYAFGDLGLQIISVQHAPENERSRRVIEKCGFVFEGILRLGARYPDGCLRDSCTYSLTLAEWQAGETREKHFYRFYQNRNCEYFPCHRTDDTERFSCQFCYCPLYLLGSECGGNFRILDNGIKDCSECLIPHYHYDRIVKTLADHVYRPCGG